MSKILIYGAYGYTGQLIIDEALRHNLNPIIAGRSADKLSALNYPLERRVFNLDNVESIIKQLSDIDILIHCAGPFSSTAAPMMQACLASKTHYTDITGEISVFELAQSFSDKANNSNIVICPGVGFDVIPTDCLASQLKEKMPDAKYLSLGFDTSSRLSPGTAKTSVEGLGQGGKVRSDGIIKSVPLAYKSRTIDFGNGSKNAVTIPWGDVSTAFYSTRIPNIEVYIPVSPRGAKKMRRLNWIRPILKMPFVQRYLKKQVGNTTKGPDASKRKNQGTYVWGEVINENGKILQARIKTANGYSLTASGAIEIARFLIGYNGTGGAFTPSTLINNQLVHQLEGSSETIFTELK
ncbi:saccharopine dehydrogenase family protein [Pleionea sediminis]|uniref:saccharopine dehydrogenase family protein n=1 Tax=Pleionea sediminis TaxID=2569479 RepID=UPI001184F995|nr:saccharopine dehydrogenase NADP-binding domain-containing protein [Pleionea sediminis]